MAFGDAACRASEGLAMSLSVNLEPDFCSTRQGLGRRSDRLGHSNQKHGVSPALNESEWLKTVDTDPDPPLCPFLGNTAFTLTINLPHRRAHLELG